MNPFELITAGCYEDNSITRILFGGVLFHMLMITPVTCMSHFLIRRIIHGRCHNMTSEYIKQISKGTFARDWLEWNPRQLNRNPAKKLWRNIWVQNGYQNARNGALFRSYTKHLILVFYVKRFYQYFYITVSYFQACNFTRKLFHTVKSF